MHVRNGLQYVCHSMYVTVWVTVWAIYMCVTVCYRMHVTVCYSMCVRVYVIQHETVGLKGGLPPL